MLHTSQKTPFFSAELAGSLFQPLGVCFVGEIPVLFWHRDTMEGLREWAYVHEETLCFVAFFR